MAVDWGKVFDNYGIKAVSNTDVSKGAYVPNGAQRDAILAAGKVPATVKPGPQFSMTVLFDTQNQTVSASYYEALRSAKANRSPEPRMGGPFVSSWLAIGDQLLIGNIGSQLFAIKLATAPTKTSAAAAAVVNRASPKNVLKKAKAAVGKPASRIVERNDFVRNPWVVAGALQRSGGRCEMPGCSRELFLKDDESPYLEVHHIVPLAEGGDDTLVNAAAICPHCHRALHHGKDRKSLRIDLKKYVRSLP